MNQNQDFHHEFLAKIDLKLAHVKIPQPETRVVFRSQSISLEQLIANLGEEEVPTGTVPKYQIMRPFVAVGKLRKAPGELYEPHAVAIDVYDRIFVAELSMVHP